MTVTHSPSPWKINKSELFDGGYHRKTYAIVDANNEPVVLFDPSQGEYSEALDINSPDVPLIAAAPDLLEALIKYMDAIDMFDKASKDGINYHGAVGNRLATEEIARAAIAKATVKAP